jgi:hypothetical protein
MGSIELRVSLNIYFVRRRGRRHPCGGGVSAVLARALCPGVRRYAILLVSSSGEIIERQQEPPSGSFVLGAGRPTGIGLVFRWWRLEWRCSRKSVPDFVMLVLHSADRFRGFLFSAAVVCWALWPSGRGVSHVAGVLPSGRDCRIASIGWSRVGLQLAASVVRCLRLETLITPRGE